ncbi:MAG: cupin domain-containing protein [Thermomicrobiales bacterium]
MTGFAKRQLPDRFAVLSGPNPPDGLCFSSDNLQILWNNSDISWSDPRPHYHQESDEVFLVLRGSVDVEVGDDEVTIGPGEVCFFPAGTWHGIKKTHPPAQFLVVRAPTTADKVYRESCSVPPPDIDDR